MIKSQLRQHAKNIRAEIGEAQRTMLSAAMVARLIPILQNENCENIGLYYPIGNEISPLDGLCRGKNVARFSLPVIRHDKSLGFYVWKEGARLIKRDFDIPIPDTRELLPVHPDVLIVPLLLCDEAGNRIGYGKGHYDRYIAARDSTPILIGVCFDEQIYDKPIAAEPHDARLDIIVTPTRVLNIK